MAAVTHPDLVAGTDTPVAAVTDTALSPVTVVITSVPWVICPDIVLSHSKKSMILVFMIMTT